MQHRIKNILIVSNPYDAYVMEEDGGLMEHVFTRHRGISLINPPKFIIVSTAEEALEKVKGRYSTLVDAPIPLVNVVI